MKKDSGLRPDLGAIRYKPKGTIRTGHAMSDAIAAERIAAERRTVWTKAGPVLSSPPDWRAAKPAARASAAIGDSASLGYFGFATGTWIMATVAVGAFEPGAFVAAAPVLLVFAGVAQFIGGLVAYRRLQVLLATEFCIFGSLNAISAVLFLLISLGGVQPGLYGDATVLMGLVLESFAFAAVVLTLAGLPTSGAALAVLSTRALGYILAGIPFLVASLGIGGWGLVGHVGAGFLFASALFAYYAGAARLVNSAWRRRLLPLWGEP